VYLNPQDEETVIKARIQKHESLLTEIASGLGINKIESVHILEEVGLQAKKQYREYRGTVPFKVWLSKILIRKCIFKISADLFNSLKSANVKTDEFEDYSIGRSISPMRKEQIPLTFRVVYMLHKHIGFTEKEVAEILNINPLKVRQRLNKALHFMGENKKR
jgi:DNA-directed RNA polymerase specialized sigma24 family protein